MNIREKAALFILCEQSAQPFRDIDKRDVRDEYPYMLKELVQDGYLDAIYETDAEGTKTLKGYQLSDRGKMKKRLLMEKWEEEQ